VDQVIGDLGEDETSATRPGATRPEQFKLAFDPKAMAAFVARMERNGGAVQPAAGRTRNSGGGVRADDAQGLRALPGGRRPGTEGLTGATEAARRTIPRRRVLGVDRQL
jgi:hypothetical protein